MILLPNEKEIEVNRGITLTNLRLIGTSRKPFLGPIDAESGLVTFGLESLDSAYFILKRETKLFINGIILGLISLILFIISGVSHEGTYAAVGIVVLFIAIICIALFFMGNRFLSFRSTASSIDGEGFGWSEAMEFINTVYKAKKELFINNEVGISKKPSIKSCPKCSSPIVPNSAFCEKCGTQLS